MHVCATAPARPPPLHHAGEKCMRRMCRGARLACKQSGTTGGWGGRSELGLAAPPENVEVSSADGQGNSTSSAHTLRASNGKLVFYLHAACEAFEDRRFVEFNGVNWPRQAMRPLGCFVDGTPYGREEDKHL